MINIKQKLNNFNNLFENRVYENIIYENTNDVPIMLEKIDINFKKGTIDIFFKKYSDFLEEIRASDCNMYVHEGPIKNKRLAREFIDLDLSDKSIVQHYINKIERQVDLLNLDKRFLELEDEIIKENYSAMMLANIEDPFFAQYGMTYEEAQRELLY